MGITVLDYYRILYDTDYDRPSIIYGLDDNDKYVPIAEFYRQARRVVHLEKTRNNPKPLNAKIIRTFISSEDTRYYKHFGIDLQSIVRAAYINLLAGRVKEGASTITQQVARLRFLNNDRSLLRKIREMFFSWCLELHFSKKQIIEIYLNMVPLGHGTNGIEAASQFYFSKGYRSLSWGEAAVLASLTTRPNIFSPLQNPRASMKKVQITLRKLIESGDISIKEAEKEFQNLIQNYYLTLNRSPNDSAFNQRLNLYPYVTEYVREELEPRFRNNGIIYTAGLQIYTTIKIRHQKAANEEMTSHLNDLTRIRKRPPFQNFKIFDGSMNSSRHFIELLFDVPKLYTKTTKEERDLMLVYKSEIEHNAIALNLFSGVSNIARAMDNYMIQSRDKKGGQGVEGGLFSLDPRSGAIRAVVGGSGFRPDNQQLRFHRVSRQPGSAFKPLIYAAAIEYTNKNYKEMIEAKKTLVTAATMFDDTPLHFINLDLTEYSPENYSREYEGFISVRNALIKSKNSVAVQIYNTVGKKNINPIVENLLSHESTKKVKLREESTVALGSYGVSPKSIALAYATFSSGGKRVHPYLISHITDIRGKILVDYREKQKQKEREQILSPSTAKITTSLLRDVVNLGTGKAARLIGRKVAGKTGTTNRSTDAWFVGYTPQLVTAIYIGYDKPKSLGVYGTGGALAAPVWGRYMFHALKKTTAKNYDFSGENLLQINICAETGLLPNAECDKRISEYFYPGTEPKRSYLNSRDNPNFVPKHKEEPTLEQIFDE